jgi:O-acetyl-ADP-ribose deacetylase (regulator of RNase III)
MGCAMPQTATALAPVEETISGAVVRIEQGDLTALAVDAIVYYAREDLTLGSGYGTAIQSRGGDAVRKELAALGTVGMGGAIMTGAGNLKARHIIHACGPKFQEEGTEEKLRACMRSALVLAESSDLSSVAFPPMGAGFYGVPLNLCAAVMLDTIRGVLSSARSLKTVIICVTDRREFAAFRTAMGGRP